jgi:hypothetical protein
LGKEFRVSRSSHAILAFLLPWLALCLLACDGTEGTLVVHSDGVPAGGTAGETAGGGPGTAKNPYVPPVDVRWWADLDGPADIAEDAELFYLDAELQNPDDLATLRSQGRHYYCYLSGGSLEGFRDDAGDFPASAIGNALADYPRERWLDVRDGAVRALMARRVTRLAELGCEGVPPSSLAVHAADTGFDLSELDALEYARWLAERLHASGMAAGLTAPLELTSELWPTFDFGLGIACVADTACAEYAPFERAKKTVLHVEIGDADAAPDLCNASKALGFSALVSDPGFTGRGIACSDLP